MRSVDLTKTKVDFGRPMDPLTDHYQRASRRLRSADGAVLHQHGVIGLALARAVLGERQPVERTARLYGAATTRETRSVSWLFRQVLNIIAKALGFATTTRTSPRDVIEPEDSALDPARQADTGDLADPRLRSARGRANGRG